MGIDSAATFLVCTILIGSAVIVLVGMILLINNMLHRYWKTLNWYLPEVLRPVHYTAQAEIDRSQEPPLHNR